MPKGSRITGEEMRRMKGTRIGGTLFTLLIAPAPGVRSKAAVVVSKKVSTKAVTRNLIQRRAREVLRMLLPALPTPVTIILYAKRESIDASFAEMKRHITEQVMRSVARENRV